MLAVCMLGMMVLAGLYLRRRPLSPAQYLAWGALILLPLVGPFLVILLQPGTPRPPARVRRRRRSRRMRLL